MKWIDMPPVWLIAAIAAAWALRRVAPAPGFGAWAAWAGPVLVVAGLVLMALAVVAFRRAGTTIVPGEAPGALITGGIFRYSRNPIYLADTLILTGFVLYWNVLIALLLVPAFAWILQVRFIAREERMLAAAFPVAFESYRAATRRWI